MKILKQILINSTTAIITIAVIGSAYAAISTVSSGAALTADSWNQIVNKFDGIWENSVKQYVDATVSANSSGYPIVRDLSINNSTAMSHLDAINYCNNLTEDWFSDWRLWTQEELSLLVWHENANWYSRSLSMADRYKTYYTINLNNWNGTVITYDYSANSTASVNCVR